MSSPHSLCTARSVLACAASGLCTVLQLSLLLNLCVCVCVCVCVLMWAMQPLHRIICACFPQTCSNASQPVCEAADGGPQLRQPGGVFHFQPAVADAQSTPQADGLTVPQNAVRFFPNATAAQGGNSAVGSFSLAIYPVPLCFFVCRTLDSSCCDCPRSSSRLGFGRGQHPTGIHALHLAARAAVCPPSHAWLTLHGRAPALAAQGASSLPWPALLPFAAPHARCAAAEGPATAEVLTEWGRAVCRTFPASSWR